VSLSATARTNEKRRFVLLDEDLSHPVIRERLTAPKPVRLVEASGKPSDRVKALIRETLDTYKTLSNEVSPAVAVIVNRVRTARLLYEQLRELAAKENFTIELLTGRCRPLDRDDIVKRVVDRCGAGREPCQDGPGLIVVATQTLEVGADLDFQGLVTECASLDALRQRFGRLDRLGRFRHARGVIIGAGDEKDDPIYGEALAATWHWLLEKAHKEDGNREVDLSIEGMERLLQDADIASLTAHPGETLPLSPLHVELLSQTSPTPMYDPDVEALLHGLNRGLRDVQVVWRANLPVIVKDGRPVLDTRELGAADVLLRAAPPMSLEAMSLPLLTARAWLSGEKDPGTMGDVEGSAVEMLDGDTSSLGLTRQALRWNSDRWEAVFARQLRPGDTIVVPAEYGGCDQHGFSPENPGPACDLSARARSVLRRSPFLVVTKRILDTPEAFDPDTARNAWERLARSYQESDFDPKEHLPALLDGLGGGLLSAHGWPIVDSEIATIPGHDGTLYALLITSRRPAAGDLSEEDLSSSQTVPITLAHHGSGVGQRARELATACGLRRELQDTLSRAGELHDLGKADPRFQQFLRGGDPSLLPDQILAKGPRRVGRSSVELGERHEAYSVAIIRSHPALLDAVADPELAEYLVGTHHGRGRPLMPERPDEGAAFSVQFGDRQLPYDGVPRLGALGSGWATLFWKLTRRYGAWGLAYLEALLRLADWLQSAEELQKGGAS
jgi:CRISPR-associated endonuclease/helicase Cas3